MSLSRLSFRYTYDMLGKLFVYAVGKMPPWAAIRFANLVAFLRHTNVFFRIHERSLIATYDGGQVHHSGTISRGLEYLTNGISQRGNFLRGQYLLNFIDEPIRRVVDVGANSGDLLLTFTEGLDDYLGIEPIEEEHIALKKNCEIRGLRSPLMIAASNTSGEVSFFVSAKKGDSSAIEPSEYTEKRAVNAETLDSIFMQEELKLAFKTIDLLKIEAEGFEPEILEGSQSLLKKCRWVTVDGGPERGVTAETTIEICANFLISRGFRMVALNFDNRPGVGLFKNSYL